MSFTRVIALTSFAMIAFAGNSLLGRAALRETAIDAASYTSIRLISGALMLALLVSMQRGNPIRSGNWLSALALFTYAAAFSFAYIDLHTGIGALLLFGAVQATMIGHGIWSGERLNKIQAIGFVLAFGGLVGLLLPGLTAPPLLASTLMLSAGISWGIYSLRGKGVSDPLKATAGNFLRASPIAAALSVFMLNSASVDSAGFLLAVCSGALTSGIGYAIWYAVLPELKSTHAATVQLSAPVIATLGGIAILGEPLTFRLVLASAAVLGGIALVILEKKQTSNTEAVPGKRA